jgi:sulfite exporter TauE/SafE
VDGLNLWSVFATGLLAGGASCAVVQGGLLAGAVARRHGDRPHPGRSHLDDVVPVGGFLAGKLVSHTLAGFLLGLVGDAAQLGFRTRALMQIGAGVVMILMAANLLGVRGLRRLVPPPPPTLARFVRRRARSQTVLGPAVLGFLTVLIPCAVTLSVMVLAIASGSPVVGALGMAVFVLGTSPLFAVLGYAVRRSGNLLRGYLGKAAAVAVVVAGLLSINSGLVLSGSPVTLERAWEGLTGGSAVAEDAGGAADGAVTVDDAGGAGGGAVTVDDAGGQNILIEVRNSSYSPSRVRATAGLLTRLTLRTDGTRGCTRGFVVPAANFEMPLPETGDTVLDLGKLAAGRINYTCAMGMYRGVIEVS